MKKTNRILSLILAGSLLLLAACTGMDDKSAQDGSMKGRFVEIDISPPIEGRFTSYLAEDGTIVCFDAGLTTRYESKDNGASWSEQPGPGRDTNKFRFTSNKTMLADGSLLAFLHDEGLVLIAPDGSSRPFPVNDIDDAIARGDSVMVSLLQALDNNRLLLSYMIGGASFQPVRSSPVAAVDDEPHDDEDEPDEESSSRSFSGSTISSWENKTLLCDLSSGAIIRDLSFEGAVAVTSDDKNLYLMDRSGTITSFNISDGSSSGKPDIKLTSDEPGIAASGMRVGGSFGGSSRVLAQGNDGALYAELEGDLLLADTDGTVRTVLERTAYAIGTPRNTVDSIFVLDDESIVVNILNNGQRSLLYKYVWDENASIDPGKTLSIWSLEDNSAVRAAIAEMRKKHPDATITYEVALDGFNAMSAADAIKNLNTRLLSGNAPDVILLDGCEASSYVDRGMMLDLSELVDFSDVFDSILNPFISDDGFYYLPMHFIMPVLLGSSDALDKIETIDDLVALALSGKTTPASTATGLDPFATTPEDQRAELYFTDLKELVSVMWASAAPGIINNNRLNTDALRQYLESVKALSDKFGLAVDQIGGGSVSMSMMFSDGGSTNLLPGSLMRYFIQHTNYAAFLATNLLVLQSMMDRDDSVVTLFPGFSPGVWQPSTMVSVSADTTRPEFAAEFIQTMLSPDVQQFNYGTGLPVTNSGLAAQIDAINNSRNENGMMVFDIDIGSLINRLETLSISDTLLSNMIWSSVERCCKGEVDVEGAVREIEQNIRTYLAERA